VFGIKSNLRASYQARCNKVVIITEWMRTARSTRCEVGSTKLRAQCGATDGWMCQIKKKEGKKERDKIRSLRSVPVYSVIRAYPQKLLKSMDKHYG